MIVMRYPYYTFTKYPSAYLIFFKILLKSSKKKLQNTWNTEGEGLKRCLGKNAQEDI